MSVKFEIGQSLWRVAERSKPCEVKIVRVDRKWLELSDGHRADVHTLWLDGGRYNSPGRCYLSREMWEAENMRQGRWRLFRSKMNDQYACPTGVTAEQIETVMQILGMMPKEKEV